jgi:hypothetical protein
VRIHDFNHWVYSQLICFLVGGDTLVGLFPEALIETDCRITRSGRGNPIREIEHPTADELTSYSGYEAYDKLSPAYQRFVEGLTALHDAPGIREEVMSLTSRSTPPS